MRDLAIILTYVSFLTIGTMSPFVLSLGYVWVDLFAPQYLGWSPLSFIPVSFVMGAAAVAAYLLLDRRAPPRITWATLLFLAIGLWITATTSWAARPIESWAKWDVAFKALMFATFIPFVVRSRVQIEAFAHVYVFSMSAHILPWAVKTVITGGGYGQSLGLVGSNVIWLSESSAVATIGIMALPLLLTLRRHSLLLPRGRIRDVVYLGTAMGGLFASIGTFARTAIVGFGVLGIAMFLRSKRKAGFLLAAAVVGAGLFAVTSDKWTARISTIEDFSSENSAQVRILVWRWTLDYVAQHPFGGGFRVWLTSHISFAGAGPNAPAVEQTGRAFHNIFFAVLGEHGYPGLFLYGLLIIVLFASLGRVIKLTALQPAHEWAHDLAKALQITIAVLLSCGNFIDISFEPLVWYLFTMVVCLREYVRRVVPAPVKGLSEVAQGRAPLPGAAARPGHAAARG
jgi:probable O-glycosylation ligase (exosortase A-associated)